VGVATWVCVWNFAGIWRLHHDIDAQRESLSQERDGRPAALGKNREVNEPGICPAARGTFTGPRAVQYYETNTYEAQANLELLWPASGYYDDARSGILLISYRFGAMFLSQAAPAGAGRPTWRAG